jgi:hypothetical protein
MDKLKQLEAVTGTACVAVEVAAAMFVVEAIAIGPTTRRARAMLVHQEVGRDAELLEDSWPATSQAAVNFRSVEFASQGGGHRATFPDLASRVSSSPPWLASCSPHSIPLIPIGGTLCRVEIPVVPG